MGSSVVNVRISRVCMVYSLSALPYLCSPFYCSIDGEFDEVAGRRSASVCTRRVWEFEIFEHMRFKKEGDERERRSPLPEIIRSSYPH